MPFNPACGHTVPQLMTCLPCRQAAVPRPLTPEVAPPTDRRAQLLLRRQNLPCRHEGAVLEFCKTCGGAGAELRHVRDCDVHERCTRGVNRAGIASCQTCQDYAQADATPLRILNLLFHLLPVKGSLWRSKVAELRARLKLFSGKRVVAVAFGPNTDAAADVVREVQGDADVIALPNNPKLREVATFLPLFSSVAARTGEDEATLYAHAKGVTHGPDSVCQPWWSTLLETMIDDWPVVAHDLARHPISGVFKKQGRGWSRAETNSDWHYSGSWFWVRNAALFTRPDWATIDQFWGGIEPYPSVHFHHDDAGCTFHPGRVGVLDLYSQKYWDQVVFPALDVYRKARPLCTSTVSARPRPASGSSTTP